MDYLKNLEIDPTAHIAPSATVACGDVWRVGAECTVLQGATIRGDFGGRYIEIGKQTNVSRKLLPSM